MSSDTAVLISKVLSLATIAGSMLSQAPQIFKIIKAKSTDGLSTLGWMISVVSCTLTVCYNYRMGNAFSTWGENLFVAAQFLILVLLKRYYDGKSVWSSVFGMLALVALICGSMHTGTPATLLISVPVPLNCLASAPQLLTNFRNGHTGQLAWVPVLLSVIGFSIRIFTTLTEVNDALVLLSIVVPFAFSVAILLQLAVLPGGGATKKQT